MSYIFQGQNLSTEQSDKTYTGYTAVTADGGLVFLNHSDVLMQEHQFLAKSFYNTGDNGWDPSLVEDTLPPPILDLGDSLTFAGFELSLSPAAIQAQAAASRGKKREDMFNAASIIGYQPSPPPAEQEEKAPGQKADPPAGMSIYGNKLIPSVKYPQKDGADISAGDGVRSKFNAWALFKYLNQPGVIEPKDVIYGGYNRTVTNDDIINPSAARIITYANNTSSLSFNYSPRDFTATEHFGQISNDYLVTLRRFAYPVPDDIINTRDFKTGSSESHDTTQPDLARAITWMSPKLGNDMKDVLGFGMKFKWKDEESSMQELQGGSGGGGSDNKRGALGSLIDGSSLLSAVESGVEGYSATQAASKRARGDGYDSMGATYPNHVYGPLNVIKKVLIREQGLEFDQAFELSFHYDLKGDLHTSPRVMFMDVMSNLLALTYNNAPFWGGGARWVGGSGNGASSTGKPFGDMEKLKSGDYAGFAKSVVENISTKLKSGFADLKAGAEGIMSKGLNGIGDSKILDNLVGGGLMKMLGGGGGGGAQGAQTAAAFLTGDPTGQWHLTIGNPMAPIMVIGNLALENSKITFEGPLGYEGFPTKMKMVCSLKPARPRDKGEIESMFNAGKGRFYLTPDVPGARDLDDVVDISQYGNKDKKLKSGMADRISDMSSG